MTHLTFSPPSPDFLRFFAAGIDRLSKREREVCQLLIEGYSTKQAAWQLGISPRTIDIHRSHIFQKTGTGSLLELVKMIAVLSHEEGQEARHNTARGQRPLRGYRAYMEERLIPPE